MNTGCRAVLFSVVFLFAAGAACAAETPSPASATSPGGAIANSALGATFVDASKVQHVRRTQTMIVEGINDQGWIVGRWTDSKGQSHRFLMNLFLPAFSDIANHGATNVQIWTISDTGQVTMDNAKSGFIACMKHDGGQCGSHAPVQANVAAPAPGFFSPALCASGCRFAEAQASVQ
jgi:hypothetical protein